MNISLERSSLLPALQSVAGITERQQTLPILNNVLFKSREQQLELTATDLEVELVTRIMLPQPLEVPAAITVPGRKLVDICRALPEGANVELHYEKDRMIVRSGRSRFNLSTMPADEFPNREATEATHTFQLPQETLYYLFSRTHFAMAQQDVRYYLNGMLLEINANTIRTVASDGHRLALNTAKLDDALAQEAIQVIIPRKSVLEILKLIGDNDSEVRLTIGNNHIGVENDNFTFVSKLIDGRYPDYQQILPTNLDKCIVLERAPLIEALTRTAVLTNDQHRGVFLQFRPELLHIFVTNPEQEQADETIHIHNSCPDVDIVLNVAYLLDALNAMDTEKVRFHCLDGDNSVLLEEDNDNDDSLFVVMPLQV